MVEKSADAFRTISEAADLLDLPQHVLRFWETRFNQIRPMKRGGGRRYYRPDDIALLRGIRHLLYGEGYTIKGVQRILRESGVSHVIQIGANQGLPSAAPTENASFAPVAPRSKPRSQPEPQVQSASVPGATDQVIEPPGPDVPAATPSPERAPATRALDAEARQALDDALRMLLECKRQLDAVRIDAKPGG